MNTTIDIYALPYPMFELTEEEIRILKLAKVHRVIGFLCSRIEHLTDQGLCARPSAANVLNKIAESLNGKLHLTNYLGDDLVDYLCDLEIPERIRTRSLLRDIWIDKLLDFNGYTG